MNLELVGDAEEELDGVLLFASCDTYHYGQELESGDFVKIPHDFSPPVSRRFATFDGLMVDALKTAVHPEYWDPEYREEPT